jgi:hypothetical protein
LRFERGRTRSRRIGVPNEPNARWQPDCERVAMSSAGGPDPAGSVYRTKPTPSDRPAANVLRFERGRTRSRRIGVPNEPNARWQPDCERVAMSSAGGPDPAGSVYRTNPTPGDRTAANELRCQARADKAAPDRCAERSQRVSIGWPDSEGSIGRAPPSRAAAVSA